MENRDQSNTRSSKASLEANAVIEQGDVVEEPEGWRFAPDYSPQERKRLTRIPPQAAQTPESMEIDLEPYANQRIRVRGLHNHPDWVYSARIVDE